MIREMLELGDQRLMSGAGGDFYTDTRSASAWLYHSYLVHRRL